MLAVWGTQAGSLLFAAFNIAAEIKSYLIS